MLLSMIKRKLDPEHKATVLLQEIFEVMQIQKLALQEGLKHLRQEDADDVYGFRIMLTDITKLSGKIKRVVDIPNVEAESNT